MSSLARQTRQLERVIHRKEKIFLMERYAAAMLQQLEPKAEEGQADEQVIDALRIAYRYVNPELGARLSALLLAYGYSGGLEAEREAAEEAEATAFAEEEEEEEEQEPKAKKGKAQGQAAGPAAEGEEDEEAGALFERDIYTGRKRAEKSKKTAGPDAEEDVAGLFTDEDETPEGDDADLFAGEDETAEEDEPKTAKKKKDKPKKSTADEEEDVAGLFADEDETAEEDKPKTAKKKKDKPKKSTADEEEDVAGLFADEDETADAADLFADDEEEEDGSSTKAAKKKKDKSRKTAPPDEEEDAAGLFADEDETAEEDEEDTAGLFADEDGENAGALFERDIYTPGKKARKKPRRGEEAEEEDADLAGDALEEAEEGPRRFKPTKGHQRKETPGFAAPESAVERDEKSRRGYDLYAPEETAEQEQEPKTRKKSRSLAAEEEEEEEEEARPKKRPRTAAEADKEEKAKKQGRETQPVDPKTEEKKLNLDALTYQVSIEDLRAHLGITLVREDHVKLIRRWEQKSRDNSIRLLLDDPKATQHPYALIPRITRYIKDGQMVQVNVLNLVRHFFQLFENVPQVIQLKNEPFFVTEVPTLEWAVVACEALPDTLNKTVLEQRTIFSHYIQKFMSNERRVRRRVLVEALYDIIVLNMVAKEPILRKTVDLTETRRGRQQQMCVNFGTKGIRISSIGRDQRHPQMGMCPSW